MNSRFRNAVAKKHQQSREARKRELVFQSLEARQLLASLTSRLPAITLGVDQTSYTIQVAEQTSETYAVPRSFLNSVDRLRQIDQLLRDQVVHETIYDAQNLQLKIRAVQFADWQVSDSTKASNLPTDLLQQLTSRTSSAENSAPPDGSDTSAAFLAAVSLANTSFSVVPNPTSPTEFGNRLSAFTRASDSASTADPPITVATPQLKAVLASQNLQTAGNAILPSSEIRPYGYERDGKNPRLAEFKPNVVDQETDELLPIDSTTTRRTPWKQEELPMSDDDSNTEPAMRILPLPPFESFESIAARTSPTTPFQRNRLHNHPSVNGIRFSREHEMALLELSGVLEEENRRIESANPTHLQAGFSPTALIQLVLGSEPLPYFSATDQNESLDAMLPSASSLAHDSQSKAPEWRKVACFAIVIGILHYSFGRYRRRPTRIGTSTSGREHPCESHEFTAPPADQSIENHELSGSTQKQTTNQTHLVGAKIVQDSSKSDGDSMFQKSSKIANKVTLKRNRRSQSTGKLSRKLSVETMEGRRLLATFSPLPVSDSSVDGTLRSAIVASQHNGQSDVVNLSEGIYRLSMGDLLINEKSTTLKIQGKGKDHTFIVVEGSRAFDVDFGATLALSGVSILGGNESEGGQLRSAGNVSISDAILEGGQALQGGSIFNGGTLNLSHVDLIQNSAGIGGAIWNHASATLTAQDIEFRNNQTTESLAKSITSAAQVGINIALDASTGYLPRVPRGGAALFNGGKVTLDSALIAGNLSESGPTIFNVGGDAQLQINDSNIFENSWTAKASSYPVVVLGVGGTTQITNSAIFNNGDTSNQQYGAIYQTSGGSIDLYQVLVYAGNSQSITAAHSSARLENVTSVRTNDLKSMIAPNYLVFTADPSENVRFEVTNSVIDLPMFSVTPEQFRSGGGNRIAFVASHQIFFNQPTDEWSTSPISNQGGSAFSFMPAGVYSGRVALPPASGSQLIDAAADGTDAGAFQYTLGLTTQGPLPTVAKSAQTILEDSSTSLNIAPVGLVSALHGKTTIDGQGKLIYSPSHNYVGTDRILAVDASGKVTSFDVEVVDQPDAPTIENFATVALGRTPVLAKWRDSNTVTDINAISAIQTSYRQLLGNPTPGADLGASIVDMGYIVDGTFHSGKNKDLSLEQKDGKYVLSNGPTVANTPSTEQQFGGLTYIPPAGFSGTDQRITRVVNSSHLTADAVGTYQVLDPAKTAKIGRISTRILDASLQPVKQIRVGDVFYVEYSIEDIRDASHPIAVVDPNFFAIDGIFSIAGTSLHAATSVNASGTVKSIGPTALGSFVSINHPSTQLAPDALRVDVEQVSFGRSHGAFYRVPIVATSSGTITTKVDFASARGADLVGAIPFDWFDTDSATVQVVGSFTNASQPEDVNADKVVSAIDALLVINRLNAKRSVAADVAEGEASNVKWDVNGDSVLSPMDALLVINYLNRRLSEKSASGEQFDTAAEGELAGLSTKAQFDPSYAFSTTDLDTYKRRRDL